MFNREGKNLGKIFFNGILNENPIFRLVLGMCPTLAVSTMAMNGISMGVATTIVLVMSNLFISLIRNIIPENVRIPAFVIVIASFVTMVQLLIKAFVPAVDQTLGIYIPLIVVNCIIFARAESFAFVNPPIPSIMDGLGMGLGFTGAITLLATIREVLGMGSFFGIPLLPYAPIGIIATPAGGFITLGFLLAGVNAIVLLIEKRKQGTFKRGEVA